MTVKISTMKGKIQIEVKDPIKSHSESVSDSILLAALIFPSCSSWYQSFDWNKQIRKDLLILIYENKKKHKFIKKILECYYFVITHKY